MWGPGAQGGFQNALAMGMQMGQVARQNQQQNALMQQRQAQIDLQQQEAQARQQQAQTKAEQDQASTFRQLLKQAETNPQQAFMAAQQLGIDVSRIPQPGTPEFEPWRQQQLFIADALERDKDSLPGLAQEVMLALPPDQRDPNSPVFRQAFSAALENKYAAEYTDEQGRTRRRAIIGQPQQQQQQAASAPTPGGEVMNFEAFQASAQQLGPDRARAFVQRLVQGGVRFAVQTPEQARQLPSGTPIVLPDGSVGVVP
jgi:hypothetical protein